jgi:hypothetical protein
MGGVGLVAAGFGLYGRFAFGDTFENHVANLIGLDEKVTAGLLEQTRERIGAAEFEARASAFLIATTEPSETLTPDSAREKAINAFIGRMFDGLVTPLTYSGLRDNTSYVPCQVLVRG